MAPKSTSNNKPSAGADEEVRDNCGPIKEEHVHPISSLAWKETPQPHKSRRQALMAAHGPELDALSVKRPDTTLYVVLAVGVQTAVAWAMAQYNIPWYGILAAAYTIGAVADHTLWVLIHDLTHDGAFETPAYNKAWQLVANFPILFPAAISFRYYHRVHHSHLNEAYGDPDLPGKLEAKIFGNSPIGKALWMLFFAFIQSARVVRFAPTLGGNEPWMIMNWVTQIAYIAPIYWFWGLPAIGYLLLSSMFSIGLHPLGARWIAEHYAVANDSQETYSYYGSFNTLALNVGYHNEHHDVPNIPWQNLPKVRSIAPEFYNTLWYHTSYWRLFVHFLLNPNFTLESRVARVEPAKIALKRDDKVGAAEDYEYMTRAGYADGQASTASSKSDVSIESSPTSATSTGGARRRRSASKA